MASGSINWRAAAAEFLTVFLFVIIGPGVVVLTGLMTRGALDPSRLIAISVAHGLAIAVLASWVGGISGGHINPAVTFAMWITKRISYMNGVAYIVAQLVGAVAGSALLGYVTTGFAGGGIGNGAGTLGIHGLGAGIDQTEGLIVEIVLTFTLVSVVFGAAVDKRGVGMVAPIAIGFTVLIDHLIGVPLTGASMNPARSFGPQLISGAGAWDTHIVVYWVGPLVGAAIAALVYKWVFEQKSSS